VKDDTGKQARSWLAFALLGIVSHITGALGRIPVLGSELEDSHFRTKKPKSRACYPLPVVRPRKGTRVISPHASELLWSCSRRQKCLSCAGKEEEGLRPSTLVKRVQGVQQWIWCGVRAHGLAAASAVYVGYVMRRFDTRSAG